MENDMSRYIWKNDDVIFLKEWWPHFGTELCSAELNITRSRIKAKIDKLRVKMLDKDKRLCISCKIGYQYIDSNINRRTNRTCKECELASRRKRRYDKSRSDKSWEELFKEIARTLRYRNKKLHNSTIAVTANELSSIYKKQHGLCYYTGRIMSKPIPTDGIRNNNVLSVDRIDSAGAYSVDNIVLCIYGSNVGKMDMSHDDYIKLCIDLANTHSNKQLIHR